MTRIKITREHIERGERNCGQRCAVAAALRSASYSDVSVDPSAVLVDGDLYSATEELEAWIRRFDRQGPVPEIMIRLIGDSVDIIETWDDRRWRAKL